MLDTKIEVLKGVGIKSKQYFNNESIYTVYDILNYFPHRYNVYEPFTGDNCDKSKIILTAIIDSNPTLLNFKKASACLIFFVKINNKRVKIMVFGQNFLIYNIKKGVKVSLNGIYNKYENYINAKKVSFDKYVNEIDVIYGIKDIKDYLVSKILNNIFSSNQIEFKEYFPSFLLEKYRLLSYDKYLYLSHFPQTAQDVHQVLRRKKYEIYFKNCLISESLNYYYDTFLKKPKQFNDIEISNFIDTLEFKLTNDQNQVIKDISNDLKSNRIMNRLVQGDVGSGKTITAVLACLMAYKSGYQIAFMAPTEVLARQTFNTFSKLLENEDICVELLTSSVLNKNKQDILNRTVQGRVSLLVGTHSLIYDTVKFNNLGLVIIDEQHKFGVKQRQKLLNKNDNIDCLYLTATPIPRTLGISKFGHLNLSSIYTMPSNRLKVKTYHYLYSQIDYICELMNNEIKKGRQVFVVSPNIYPVEGSSYSVLECFDILNSKIEGNIKIIHGDLGKDKVNENLNLFIKKKVDVLISTTIIEVGVDIKNATMMVIFQADRFGLSQLHQLRGRVGRNSYESYCILLSKEQNNRLDIMLDCNDCFVLSEEDLKTRGPGDVLGEKQSGFLSLGEENDINIYNCAKKDAKMVYNKYVNSEINDNYIENIIKESIDKKIIN